jgi:Fe-S cluster assembly protein SufD
MQSALNSLEGEMRLFKFSPIIHEDLFMSIVIEKLDNQSKTLTVNQDDLTYLLLAAEPGTKELTINLSKEGLAVNLLGIFICRSGVMKIRTIQHHAKPHASSNLLFKTVVLGPGRFDYEGLIRIDKGADGSDAYQRHDSLLLHEKAQVETRPVLEIEADEVRCTHGATIGQLDEEQIFYLTTRGLNKATASELILQGFLGEVAEQIGDLQAREKVLSFIQQNLNYLEDSPLLAGVNQGPTGD